VNGESRSTGPDGTRPASPQSSHACDLCGLPLPRREITAAADGKSYRFCCSGCRQVFLLLHESGLLQGDYRNSEIYQTSLKLGIIGRDEPDPQAPPPSSVDLAGTHELVLRVDGMWCSSCSWLIEKAVAKHPGVAHAQILYASDTARIHYRPESVSPGQIAKAITALGYSSAPRDANPEESAPERKSLLIKMGVALFAMMNAMMYSYALYFGYVVDLPPEVTSLFPLILFGFATPTVFWCGSSIHRKAWRSVAGGSLTMEVLFSIGIFASYAYSVHSLVTGGEHVYFDTGIGLTALLLVGKFIEMTAKNRASENIHRLYQMLPKKVRLRGAAGEKLVSIDRLQEGDVFIVKSGEKIPADGTIVTGRTVVDESLLTGEAVPVEKREGDTVIASSLAVNGLIEVRATRIGKDTMVSSLIGLVERALSTKSDLEHLADRVSRVFIPAVITLALVVGGTMVALGSSLHLAILRMITVLVIACPCVLGMATPLAVAAGIGYAARRGILFHSGTALRRAASVGTVIFDKTGTLTEGNFTLRSTFAPGHGEERALLLAASLERGSNHPLASAFVSAARSAGITLDDPTAVTSVHGKGISGIVGHTRVVLGSRIFVAEQGFAPDEAADELAEREAEAGNTVVYCGIGDSPDVACFILGDSIKPSATGAVEALAVQGKKVHLLSGDLAATTGAIAKQTGIASSTAQVLPQEKMAAVEAFQRSGEVVAMVGDGVNDAPALAQADLGIAMGSGTDLAVESAPVTLLRDDLMLVPEALDIARRSFRIVRQNLVWAFFYNTIGLAVAAFGLLNPLMAAGAMLASSLSVVLNSMRLSQAEGLFGRRIVEILLPWIEPDAPSAEVRPQPRP
jgi:P-type Cu2+ transporter